MMNASTPIGEPTLQAWKPSTWIMHTARRPWMSNRRPRPEEPEAGWHPSGS